MNASPSGADLPLYYDLMIYDHTGGRLLLCPEGDGWSLPRFRPDVTDFRRVHHINDDVKQRYGLESAVLRCVTHRQDWDRGLQYRLYALENSGEAVALRNGAVWMDVHEIPGLSFTTPAHQESIETGLQEVMTHRAPELRAPWAIPGWLDEATDWIQTQLQQLNIDVRGPVVQDRAWALSCILRLETSRGQVYFKAVPPFMAHEGRVVRELSRHAPDLVPSPLATDDGRGWLLMSDFGSDALLRTPDLSRWEDALQRIAQLQVEQTSHVSEWLAQGVPDRGLSRMVQLTDPLMAISTQLLAGASPGLSETEVDGLRALPMKMKLLCAKLASYDVPHTLVHGDLGGNIQLHGERYIVFDWTDVCIAHPFFEMTTLIDTVFDESVLPPQADVRTQLRDAYLAPWITYAPMARLVEAFELTKSLGALHQAMSYMWILMNVAEDARWELESGLLMWLRRLLPSQPSET